MVETYLAHPERPTSGGIVPHINLTVPLPVLIPDSPAALFEDHRDNPTVDSVPRLGFTGPLSPQAARELACGDNEIAAILLADGVPLSISNNERLATGRLRIALAARDQGCQFPGCGRPASWCHAHHIQEWADGGQTCLTNMCLLCPFHYHTAVHTQGWKIRMGSDGYPWFQPPQGGDWMPCHQRRTQGLTLAA